MNDQERAGTQAALNKALADRQRLDVVIDYLSEQLGIPVPTGPSTPPNGGGGGSKGNGRVGGDPVEGTAEGEYFGYNSTKAALEVLSKFGDRSHALKTKQIYDALRRGGVSIGSEEALYTSLARSGRFRKVGRGLWGLTEWYPAAAPKAPKGSTKATNVHSLSEDEAAENDADTEVQTA